MAILIIQLQICYDKDQSQKSRVPALVFSQQVYRLLFFVTPVVKVQI